MVGAADEELEEEETEAEVGIVVAAALVVVGMLVVLVVLALELVELEVLLLLLLLLLEDRAGLDDEELETKLLLALEEVGLVVTVLMVVCEEEMEDVVPRWIELDGEGEVVGPLLPVVVIG